jgi:hypothetical protein
MEGSLPAWLTELLKQFPVVVLCGFVLWRAAKYLDSKHRAELDAVHSRHGTELRTVRELTARHIEDLKAQHTAQIESMTREINRLVTGLGDATRERDRLLRRLVPDNKGEGS